MRGALSGIQSNKKDFSISTGTPNKVSAWITETEKALKIHGPGISFEQMAALLNRAYKRFAVVVVRDTSSQGQSLQSYKMFHERIYKKHPSISRSPLL